MKLFFLLLGFYVAFVSTCRDDTDCKDGCCIGVVKLKKCLRYLKYGEKCTWRKKMGARCVCEPGLECKKTGFFKHRCKYPSSNIQHPIYHIPKHHATKHHTIKHHKQ